MEIPRLRSEPPIEVREPFPEADSRDLPELRGNWFNLIQTFPSDSVSGS